MELSEVIFTPISSIEYNNLRPNLLYSEFVKYFLRVVFIAFFVVIKLYRKNKQKNVQLENQKNLIEEKQSEILSSIRYAKRIQESLFPSQKYISKKIN